MCRAGLAGDDNSTLVGVFESLCYSSGRGVFDVKRDVREASEEYVAAYTQLNENLRAYRTRWEVLGDDFYQ